MRNILLLLAVILILLSSCDPNSEEDRKICYSYLNGTDRNVKLELYNYNGGRLVTEIGTFSINEQGLLIEKCKVDNRRIPGPTTIYEFDSIVVKFDNNKKLTYLWRFGQSGDSIFFPNFYQQQGESNNFTWTFTEEDYNNAVPY